MFREARRRSLAVIFAVTWGATISAEHGRRPTIAIPRTWDDAEIARHEVPLADPVGSPRHASSDYYYRIPVRPIYKGYPVYAPGREPAGYLEGLKQQEPVVIWDDKDKAPPLETEADWIRAGQTVFEAPLGALPYFRIEDVRDPDWVEATGAPVAADGTLPVFQYLVRRKGTVELGSNACAFCHTRVMPDGGVLRGAQGNFPVQRAFAYGVRHSYAAAGDKEAFAARLHGFVKSLHAAPWMRPDPEAPVGSMSVEEIASVFEVVPPSASLRHRSNSFLAVQVPDLIGVKERRYLDRTGLEVHRSIGDMMRYAAMNQGGDSLASYAGFIPAGGPGFQERPAPESRSRYSDEQLYALALYIYSLAPPPNPNEGDALAVRGRGVFEREHCGSCHTPPLYTNNKLTPASGFQVPPDHWKTYDILPVSVGTDTRLTLTTRRGTGYYKVPSLQGLWYRSAFPHDGSCATLEDWFDPARLKDDYVPTGFKGYGVRTRAVPGHEFGLALSPEDKHALITFLKTL